MLLPIAVFLLTAVSAAALLFAAFHSRLSSSTQLAGRLERIAAADGRGVAPEDNGRKHLVEQILRDIEEKQRAQGKKAKLSLKQRMRQAGLGWSRATYLFVCLGSGITCFAIAVAATGIGVLPAAALGISGGLLGPHLYVSWRRNTTFKRFSAEFPNALDVIVRGVKSGLPLGDCFRIIATEAQDPVRREFQIIAEDQTIGIPLEEAAGRMAERMPISESIFFGIVIAIQSRTGGSLSGALGNLAHVLRERKKMQAKIKALSSEAKASAGIIASLPFAVSALVYLTTPDYIALLFTTLTGNLVLAASGIWMLIGVLVMRKMINFKF